MASGRTVIGDWRAAERTVSEAVDRVAGLSDAVFTQRYVQRLVPVVLTDATTHWRALRTWTPSFFRREHGTRAVVVDGRELVLADLIDQIERSTPATPAPYLRNLDLAEWSPALMREITPMPRCTRPNWLASRLLARGGLSVVELYIGGAGASFPILHYDTLHTHAFLMQLFGIKEYILYAPDQTPYLYPRSGIEKNKSSIDDVEHLHPAAFPLFAHARAYRLTLGPGETLFVPAGWWHTARILEPSITVSINTANEANWSMFCQDYLELRARHYPPWRAGALSAYLQAVGVFEQTLDRLGRNGG